jgi:hypothetical protein
MQMRVSAIVQRHASIRVSPPLSLTISDADIARGYVELATPLEIKVRSNVPEGYTLTFDTYGADVRGAAVQSVDAGMSVTSTGNALSRPGAGRGTWQETLQLRIRFQLAPQARAGIHAWPLQISMASH